jgi:FAD/FMN-containing dehydrogenase
MITLQKNHIDGLQKELAGRVMLPGDADYERAIQIDNGRIRGAPALVVMPFGARDIALALRFAQDQELEFGVLGGGHGAAGYCLPRGGMVLDMSAHGNLWLHPEDRTLRVQAGARWGAVYRSMEAGSSGLIPVGGGCLSVGVVGFVLGGGYSFVSRSYGLGIDNLISMELVTADGRVRRIGTESTSEEDKRLFWACRGGGGGNYGVVTEMLLRSHRPAGPTMLAGYLTFPLEAAPEVIGLYNEWVETVPDELCVYGYLGTRNGVRTCMLTPVYNGDTETGMKLLEPLLALAPAGVDLHTLTLPEWEDYNQMVTTVRRRNAYVRSGFLPPRALTPGLVRLMVDFLDEAPSSESFVVWLHAGGRIGEIGADATAFPHRGARFLWQLKSVWDEQSDAENNIDWALDFGKALSPHFDGAYVNYIDPQQADWQRMYYKDNYDRLLAIKSEVDPNNFFRFDQSIGSAYQPRTRG